ncbi:hypothetical protein J6590_049634 [Homalodisca vitripennis]|nr:hypothetical protein J6590_049634 [Homalodisca vitripennis]
MTLSNTNSVHDLQTVGNSKGQRSPGVNTGQLLVIFRISQAKVDFLTVEGTLPNQDALYRNVTDIKNSLFLSGVHSWLWQRVLGLLGECVIASLCVKLALKLITSLDHLPPTQNVRSFAHFTSADNSRSPDPLFRHKTGRHCLHDHRCLASQIVALSLHTAETVESVNRNSGSGTKCSLLVQFLRAKIITVISF